MTTSRVYKIMKYRLYTNKKDYGIIPNTILFDIDLTDKQKLLYCYISSLANDNAILIDNNNIAIKMGVTKNTISKNINILEKKGYFKIENPLSRNRLILIIYK